MYPSRRIQKRKLAGAIAISIAIHALVLFLWLSVHPGELRLGAGLDSHADAPGDINEVTFTFIDLPAHRESKVTKTQPKLAAENSPPNKLPESVVENGIGSKTREPIVPAVHQSKGSETESHTGAVSAPLHGKLKAGKSITYVLDRSSSMANDKCLDRAIATLQASLKQLDADSRFKIVAYNSIAIEFSRDPQPATPRNIEKAMEWLHQLKAEGRSNHIAGFRAGLYFRPDVLFLLTDADDLEIAEVKTIESLIRSKVFLYAAIFTGTEANGPASSPLDKMVRTHNGKISYQSAK